MAELSLGERAGGWLAGRSPDLEGIGAGGVGDPDRLPGLAEHSRQAAARLRVDHERASRAVLVRQPVHRAADLDHAGLTGPVAIKGA